MTHTQFIAELHQHIKAISSFNNLYEAIGNEYDSLAICYNEYCQNYGLPKLDVNELEILLINFDNQKAELFFNVRIYASAIHTFHFNLSLDALLESFGDELSFCRLFSLFTTDLAQIKIGCIDIDLNIFK